MIAFWKFVMIATMVLFFPAAIVVAIKGFGDVIRMFADLGSEDPEESASSDD